MHRKIRVLVVDDSVVMRHLLADLLAADPACELAGTAANGKIGLAMIEQTSPDVVTLDVDMPVLDGLETLKQIRAKYRRLPVVMVSCLTARGAETTIDALAAGASDYLTKPAGASSLPQGRASMQAALIPKIKALCGWKAEPDPSPLERPRKTLQPAGGPIEVLVMGSSTGGPNALSEILPCFPADLPVPVLIVQHMMPGFTKFLAQRLNSAAKLPVAEAEAGVPLQPGRIWIAPGDHHLQIVRDLTGARLSLTQEPPENSCRPSVDVLFRSAARGYRSGVLAVILTGMGQDGLRGCQQLADVGAQIVAQDEATSVVWGMPGFVAKAGLAYAVLPLAQIGPELVRRVSSSRCSTNPAAPSAAPWEPHESRPCRI